VAALVPIALAILAWIAAALETRALLWAAGILALGFCLLSGFSIGLWYLPSAIVLLVAAGMSVRRPDGDEAA
jgi:hypothetical protein